MTEQQELPSDLAETDAAVLRRRCEQSRARLARRGHAINMARGKPAPDQLDGIERLLELPGRDDYRAANGTDCRNYGGGADGLPEARTLLSTLVGATPENTIVAGNSSIALMHDHLVYALLKGNPDSPRPWMREGPTKFVCPVPGYDFHFNMIANYGLEMIPVPLTGAGPDMDRVEALVAGDERVKGIWCVPKYSNPTGETYAPEVIKRLARMPTAAPDFRVFWDNAYAVHHLTAERVEIRNLIDECARAGRPDRALVFASTSKITFPGAGLAVFGSSPRNVAWFRQNANRRSIGPDKLNQLRHMRLLPDRRALDDLMQAHRRRLAPKFAAVDRILETELGDYRIATWTRPKGGYFISLYMPAGCARRSIERAGQAGVTLTPAGAAFPYGYDPTDRHIRIAPTGLPLADVETAARTIAHAVLLSACEQELARRRAKADGRDSI